MLACVCQPQHQSIFRNSSVPLEVATTPFKQTIVTNQAPKPGKIIRIYPPSTYNDCHDIFTKNIEGIKGLDKSSVNEIRTEYKIVLTQGTKEKETKEIESTKRIFKEKLPDGVQLTLDELRDMACRQQAQIDAQHQLLAAKEQRLRYLKDQEARQQRVQAESERLRRLRERVEAQELKLRKLRALRGQVDHQKQNNITLTSDLDSIRALFNEKEKELSLAVAKVEELTRQLEELRRGRLNNRDPPPASTIELDKLRRELMYRNKLNEQQNQRLSQQREALTARQDEMSAIDKRISELQERLHRKRTLNQQLASQISAASHKAAYQQLVRLTLNTEQNNQAFAKNKHPSGSNALFHPPNGLLRGNIAAVEPYNHVPLQSNQQIRNINQKQENTTYQTKYQQNEHSKPDFIEINRVQDVTHINNKQVNLYYAQKAEEQDHFKDFSVSKLDPKYQTLPHNTKFAVNLLSNTKQLNNEFDIADLKESNNCIGPTNTYFQANHLAVHNAPFTVQNQNPVIQQNEHEKYINEDKENVNADVAKIDKPKTHSNEQPFSTNNFANWTPTISYQKPISSVAPTSIHLVGVPSAVYQTSSIKIQPVEPQTISSKVLTPVTPLTYSANNLASQIQSPDSSNIQSLENSTLSSPQSSSTPVSASEPQSPRPALPPKPAIKPPPRLSQIITEENSKPVPLPLAEQPDEKSPTLVAKANGIATAISRPILNNTSISTEMIIKAKPLNIKKQPLIEQPKLRSYNSNTFSKNGVSLVNRKVEIPAVFTFAEVSTEKPECSQQSSSEKETTNKDESDRLSRSSVEDSSDSCRDTKDEVVIRRYKKGNLKQIGKVNLSRRVSFDPLALLLDASLEGELELVKKTATQVTNPSAANDEGITALHNAICAGHFDIVKFLVEFGCDVNAQDSDGWTPLHCAASCNNLAMVKFLVEHGACIFATTLSDHETAAEKCEEDEEGFDGCSEYLYSVQEKLGILNGGLVYAVFDYAAQQPDELTFSAGQQFTILRKGDENEREWWWSKLEDREGYVPRNLLGLYPRVQRAEEVY